VNLAAHMRAGRLGNWPAALAGWGQATGEPRRDRPVRRPHRCGRSPRRFSDR
jgi:hypothetical protein